MSDYQISSSNYNNLSSKEIEGGYVLFNEIALKHWKKLFTTWIECISNFCNQTNGMSPYLDNEMGNVGLLMSAAWLTKGIAVCEKLVNHDDRDTKVRLDLWMKLADDDIEEFIEAKHTYHIEKLKKDKMTPDKYDYTYLKEKVIERAGKTIITNNQRALAIIFLTQNINKYKAGTNIDVDDKIKLLLNEPTIRYEFDAVAWCFPKIMKNKDFPGVILSVKCVSSCLS